MKILAMIDMKMNPFQNTKFISFLVLQYHNSRLHEHHFILLYIMIQRFQRKGNSNHSSYCNCSLILKKECLQKINSNKNTLHKVTDLLFERQLFKEWRDRMPDLLLHLLNFTKVALFGQNTKQQCLKRYLQWL
jgi:hypothetical protein